MSGGPHPGENPCIDPYRILANPQGPSCPYQAMPGSLRDPCRILVDHQQSCKDPDRILSLQGPCRILEDRVRNLTGACFCEHCGQYGRREWHWKINEGNGTFAGLYCTIFHMPSFRKSKFFGTSITSLDPETVQLLAFSILSAGAALECLQNTSVR